MSFLRSNLNLHVYSLVSWGCSSIVENDSCCSLSSVPFPTPSHAKQRDTVEDDTVCFMSSYFWIISPGPLKWAHWLVWTCYILLAPSLWVSHISFCPFFCLALCLPWYLITPKFSSWLGYSEPSNTHSCFFCFFAACSVQLWLSVGLIMADNQGLKGTCGGVECSCVPK